MKVKETRHMLIGELSRRTGVNAHQLRYYEAQGLLAPTRGSNGYRDYGADAVAAVIQIRRLLDAGLSTEEIRYLQPCLTGTGPVMEACPELLDVLRTRLATLDEQLTTLNRSRRALADHIDATEQRAARTGP